MKFLPCGSDVDNAGHHTGAKTNLKIKKIVEVIFFVMNYEGKSLNERFKVKICFIMN